MSWEEWSEVRAEEREMRAEEEEIMAEGRIGEMEILEEMQMDAEMRQALYGQKTITGAATGLGAAGKALAKFAKAALPILVHILNMLSTVLSWGSQGSCPGLAFLAQNLWIEAIVIAGAIFRYLKNRRKK